jgi:hypothetical protein
MRLKALTAILGVLILTSAASAQRAEVTISLNEAFFDAFLDSVFQNFDPLEFSIAGNFAPAELKARSAGPYSASFAAPASGSVTAKRAACTETIKIIKEAGGVRTAVRFREGKIYVPLAFSGSYSPPFVGCVEFGGWAEANIDLEFDQNSQRLIGRARVLNVNLNGSGGLGGTLIAKMLQTSIDRKLNPIEILRLDKLSFGVPIQKSGSIRMIATGVRPEVAAGVLNVTVAYRFQKN